MQFYQQFYASGILENHAKEGEVGYVPKNVLAKKKNGNSLEIFLPYSLGSVVNINERIL